MLAGYRRSPTGCSLSYREVPVRGGEVCSRFHYYFPFLIYSGTLFVPAGDDFDYMYRKNFQSSTFCMGNRIDMSRP